MTSDSICCRPEGSTAWPLQTIGNKFRVLTCRCHRQSERCGALGGRCRAGCGGRCGERCTCYEYREPHQNRHSKRGRCSPHPRVRAASPLYSIQYVSYRTNMVRIPSGGLRWKGSDPTAPRAATLPPNWPTSLSRLWTLAVREALTLSGGYLANACALSVLIRT